MVGVGLPDSWAAATDCDQLLDMIRAGDKALDAYGVGSLAVKVSAALTRVLLTCHNMFAHFKLVSTNRRGSACSFLRGLFAAQLQQHFCYATCSWCTATDK